MTPYFEAPGVTLYLGDALEVLPTLEARSVDAVITDPPYGSNDGCGKVIKRGSMLVTFGESWDTELPLEWIALGQRVLKVGCWMSVFTDKLSVNTLWKAMKDCGMFPKQTFYWIKTNPPPQPRKNFCSGVESAVVATNGPVKRWFGGGITLNYFKYPIVTNRDRTVHPTQKPVEVMQYLIEVQTVQRDLILDPFLGSGTTAVAALRLGRRCIGIDIGEPYLEIAARRIERELAQPRLFTPEPEAKPEQGGLW